jgi:phosphatidylinositol alpha-1,6-mannosyltransferase
MTSSSTKIKILLLAFDYRPRLGGVATCAFELANALAELPDVEIKVLAPTYSSGEKSYYDKNFSCERITLPESAWLAVIPLTLKLFFLKLKYKPDVIISMLWFPEGLSNYLASKFSLGWNIPHYIFAHGVEILESKSSLKKRIRGFLKFVKIAVFKDTTKIFAVSKFTKEQVAIQCCVSNDQISIVNNGVDLNKFLPSQPSSELVKRYQLENKKIFLTITRLDDYKGIDVTLKALSLIIPQHKNVMYLVGGIGPDLPRLENIVKELKLQNHVQFLGKIPEEQLIEHYNLADCFILNSRTDWQTPNYEGFGIVFLEAAACEKPIIAGNSGGISDAVSHNQNGWLVNPEDPKDLAQIMNRILENPELGIKFGKEGRIRIQNGFTWQHSATKIYNEVKIDVRN